MYKSLLLGSLAAITYGTANAAEWTVNEEVSSIGFTAEQQGSRFNGRFETFDAMIDFDPSKPDQGHIVGSVVTDTVSTRDHDRDASLADSDWFDSANFPEARYESKTIIQNDDGSFRADGELTLKGNTKPAILRFTFDSTEGGADFAGSITINRFDFKVGEGWNDTSWIGQNVEVAIALDLSQ